MSQWIRLLTVFLLACFAAIPHFALAQQRVQIRPRIQINGRIFGANGQIQINANGGPQSDSASVDGVFLPPDRSAKRRLDSAKEMIEQKRYGEGVRYLGSLMEAAEDFFFKPDPSQNVFRSLKAEAGRLIGEMPKEGRESYELQFGARARRMLEEAVAKGDIEGVAEVSRQFFYTQAGADATLLLGKSFWDQGQPLAAALCLSRLQELSDTKRFEPTLSLLAATSWGQAGETERAKSILIALKEQSPDAEVVIGGQSVKLFRNDGQSLAWLEGHIGSMQRSSLGGPSDWTMFRGDAARNATVTGELPLLNPRWRVQCADEPQVAEAISRLEDAYREENIAAIPSAFPLAVGDTILMRTTRSLMAVDFATGKRVWEPPSSFRGEETIDQIAINPSRQSLGVPSELLTAIGDRVWNDAPFGTLSSDGENVYMIEDLSFAPQQIRPRRVVGFNGQTRSAGPRDSNRLAALELKTEGKLRWEVGGPDGEDEPKLAGAFFLGAPLPILGRLYVIAEMKGQEIRLIALSADTGRLEWSQQLAVVESDVTVDVQRRRAGAAPSFADGIMICPTSAGAVVAVDLAMRSLLWGFQYPRGTDDERMDRLQFLRARMVNITESQGHDAWADSSATIAGGKVLLTPVESNALYCLDLIDGSVVWKQDRGNDLYVAAVHNDRVILVGRSNISAIDLANGKGIWSKAFDSSSAATPSGRGFLSGESYFLPLTSAEVIQVDVNKGEIVSRARSRRGEVPGNLICYRGEVLSQGTHNLECFYQLESLKTEVAERLRTNPDDPQALLRLGEINFDAGNVDEAAVHFRRANALEPDEATAELLVESLLAGLRADFANHRNSAAELETLLRQKSHWISYLRFMAEGLRANNEEILALDTYLRIANFDQERAVSVNDQSSLKGSVSGRGSEEVLDEVADGQFVSRDRWLRTRLEMLRANAAAAQKAEIDRRIEERITTAIESKDPDAMRRWIEIGGSHVAVDGCRKALVSTLGGVETVLERERILRKLVDSTDAAMRPWALTKLAAVYAEAKQPDLAASTYLKLRNDFGDVSISLDKTGQQTKTGKQIVAELPNGPVKEAMAAAAPWPVGLIEARDDKPKRTLPGNRQRRAFDLIWNGDPGEFFEDSSVVLEPQQQSVLCLDKMGNERFRIAIGEPNQRRGFMQFNNAQFNSVSADGPILVYSTGFQVMALDALRPQSAPAKPLWSQNLNERFAGMNYNFNIHQQLLNIAWGDNKLIAQDSYGRPIGSMGTVTPAGVVIQRFHDLLCLDPLTGAVVWQRRNAPQGCDVFGEEELLIAAPNDGSEAIVLKAADGELVGKCKVVPVEQRMASVGRLMLTWQADGGRSTMSLVDPWKNDTLWTHHFSPNSKASLVRKEVVGVMEPNGKFSLFRIPTGERLINEQLASEKSLTSIYLIASQDQYLLVTNSPPRNIDPRAPIQPAPGGSNNPLINGRVYAFSRETFKSIWPSSVRVQNHGLLVSQPVELPVLVFMRSVYRNVGGTHQPRASLLVIDKRNGRTVYKNDELQMMIQNAEFSGDRSNSTVSLLLPGKTITLTCTEKPLPPIADVAEQKKRPEGGEIGRAVGGIFRPIDNAARRMSGLPTIEEDDDPFGDLPAEEEPAKPAAGEEKQEKQADDKTAEKVKAVADDEKRPAAEKDEAAPKAERTIEKVLDKDGN